MPPSVHVRARATASGALGGRSKGSMAGASVKGLARHAPGRDAPRRQPVRPLAALSIDGSESASDVTKRAQIATLKAQTAALKAKNAAHKLKVAQARHYGLEFDDLMLAAEEGLINSRAADRAGLSSLEEMTEAAAAVVAAGMPEDAAGVAVPDRIPQVYDPEAIAAYWSRRPMRVAKRAGEVLGLSTIPSLGILKDFVGGNLSETDTKRAKELKELITRLGPVCIKVGQTASIRVDLIPPNFIKELQTLQDKVPPFSNDLAFASIERELGRPVSEVFSEISKEPVAAASLGQVYKGKLRGIEGRPEGMEVAVKVQRPNVLEGVSLDVHVLRGLCVMASSIPQMTSDLTAVLDDWALRFFEEMDYVKEAENTMRFAEDMKGLDGIMVPTVYPDLCTREVLVTGWVEGEKLSESKADDVRELVTTMLNSYLIQLLETGFLHADPHPGNLLRTPDGKICVLDFGLMTEVTEDRRMALVEYIAHLSIEDYNAVAHDLIKLGFVPEHMEHRIPEIAPLLGTVMEQITQGGGAGKINLELMMNDMEELVMDYPGSVEIPSYFALILRAFGTLEGIGLKCDPDYAIVNECFPYLSRRLVQDNHPRMRKALKELLYGNGKRLDIERLEAMASGFSSFTTDSAAGAEKGKNEAIANGQVSPMVRDSLLVLFDPKGNYLQELLLDEMVAAVDAMSREALLEVGRLLVGATGAAVGNGAMRALGPLRLLALPGPLPHEVLLNAMSSMQPVVGLDDDDREALKMVRSFWALVSPSLRPQVRLGVPSPAGILRGAASTADTAGQYAQLAPELLPGMRVVAGRFQQRLLQRVLARLADSLREPGGMEAMEELARQNDAAAAAKGGAAGAAPKGQSPRA